VEVERKDKNSDTRKYVEVAEAEAEDGG